MTGDPGGVTSPTRAEWRGVRGPPGGRGARTGGRRVGRGETTWTSLEGPPIRPRNSGTRPCCVPLTLPDTQTVRDTSRRFLYPVLDHKPATYATPTKGVVPDTGPLDPLCLYKGSFWGLESTSGLLLQDSVREYSDLLWKRYRILRAYSLPETERDIWMSPCPLYPRKRSGHVTSCTCL